MFYSIDIHIPFPVSCLFSKIMKYVLYNTQGKGKYIYFFMSQDEFYLSFIGEKVKPKKKNPQKNILHSFHNERKKLNHYAPEFSGD